VEDSGELSIYKRGFVMSGCQTFLSQFSYQTLFAGLYPKPSYLSNPYMHGLGIIAYRLCLVKPISCKTFVSKKFKFVSICGKKLIKRFERFDKYSKNQGKIYVLRNVFYTRGFGISFDPPLQNVRLSWQSLQGGG
jgi:hypothetical protein